MATATAGPASPPDLARQDVRVVMAGLLTLVLLAALDQTVMATALPRIAQQLGGLDRYSLAVAAFLLPGTAAMPLYGKATDVHGPRPVLAVAGGLFVTGSLLCGLSQTMDQLVWSRGLQGLGAGGLVTLAFTVTFLIAPPADRPVFQSLFGVTFSVASLAGPLAGGALAEQWRWLFLANVPLGLAAVGAVSWVLRRVPTQRRGGPLDRPGAVLLLAAALLWLAAIFWAGTTLPLRSLQLGGLLTAAAAVTVVLLVHEKNAVDPILPLHLFRDRTFALTSLAAALLGAILFGGVLFLPLYLQLARGTTPTVSGLAMVPMMVAVVAASMLSARAIGRTGRFRVILITGAALVTGGTALASALERTSPPALVAAALLLLGAGLGMCMQNLIVVAQSSLPPHQIGAGTSLTTFSRQLGASLGVALLGALLNAQWTGRLNSALTASGRADSPSAEQLLQAHRSPADPLVIDAFLSSFRMTMLAATALAALLITVCVAVPHRHLPQRTAQPS